MKKDDSSPSFFKTKKQEKRAVSSIYSWTFLFLFLSILLIISSACGITKLNTHANDEPSSPVSEPLHQGSENHMTTVLQTTAIENGIKLFFTLKNTTEDAITYTFNTSQRFEVEVKNSEGTTVYRYSTHRMFTQVLGKLNLDKNEEKTFEATVTPLKPGDYIIRVWLTANEDQPEARSHFSIN